MKSLASRNQVSSAFNLRCCLLRDNSLPGWSGGDQVGVLFRPQQFPVYRCVEIFGLKNETFSNQSTVICGANIAKDLPPCSLSI